uniref:DYW domain-containing protein n=1 Tax=Kalanchoe fedtschenkoi TaxID=63787 RepID=A0A7N0UU04_KALFE
MFLGISLPLRCFLSRHVSWPKLFCTNGTSNLDFAARGMTAVCSATFDSVGQMEDGFISLGRGGDGLQLLCFMEERGIAANYQTYQCLLDSCFRSGSVSEAMKIHGRILRSGFAEEHDLSSCLVHVYLSKGEFNNAIQLFDDLPIRKLSLWNELISGLFARNLINQVLDVFSRMLQVGIGPDTTTFSTVLRACGGGKVALNCIQQIHAKVIYCGFQSNELVCNPLIDLYSKMGLVDSAQMVFEELRVRDNVSWVAMISGFSQNGLEKEALHVFIGMHTSGVFPTPYVISSCLSACTKVELFELGAQLHALVFKWGFSTEIFVCNALVTLYSRSGNLLNAEEIFKQMKQRDRVSYNTLISGLAQSGHSDRAIQLYRNMQLDGLTPDCVTVASLLSACASTVALHKGKQLHGYTIKSGMSADVIIEGSVLDLYVKCSDIETAYEFFMSTETENVVLWNVMLVAYGQLGDLSKALKVYSQMQIEGLIPNQYTYPSILRTCTSVGALDVGEQIHSQVVKTGFRHNVYVCSVLIDMYAKHGKLDVARGIFERLDEDDVVAWTAMIAGYTQHDLFAESLKLFKKMRMRAIQSDNIVLSNAISGCASMQASRLGKQIHGQSVIHGYSFDLSVGNALVSLYARCGRVQDAYLAFDRIDEKDSVTWNGLISGLSQSQYYEEALNVFYSMNQAGFEADLFTFASAVSAAANMANVKQGKQIHAIMIKTGYDLETEACNAIITLYAKCGHLGDSRKEFMEMPDKNEISWNSMITAFSQHGFGVEALNLFEEMKRSYFVPNHVTFLGVLSACSHVGLVDVGMQYFKSMSSEFGLAPKPEHYASVVDLLGRAGYLSRAKDFINDMPIKSDAMVWRTLLSACRVHKNSNIAEFAAHHLLQLEPEDSATYVLLSNIYAVAGKWECRDQVRQMMKDRGVKKEPGRSWINVGNSVHAFYVGDRLHYLADKIYDFLDDLNGQATKVGYIQEPYCLWNEMEQKQNDPTVYVHSEKLAISFGLLTLSSKMPIHVFKNLRVCNDCHNWIKFVSVVSSRIIVVRDAYRFHHFEGGKCSCKDYW